MKLSWKLGGPVGAVLLIGARGLEAPLDQVLMVAAMGIFLWTAFSLPLPERKPPPELEGENSAEDNEWLEEPEEEKVDEEPEQVPKREV